MKYCVGLKTGVALLLAAQLFIMPAAGIQAAAAPSDLGGHWANATITAWLERGLVSGDPDGRFRPDDKITRAELVKLVNRAFGYTQTREIHFTDAVSGQWYYPELQIAGAAGYIQGYADGSFGPNRPVSRQELAVMLGKLLKVETKDYIAQFSDTVSSPDWSKPSIAMAAVNGLMGGYPDGTFKPAASLTRAEAVVILDRTLSSISGGTGTPAASAKSDRSAITYANGLRMGSGRLAIFQQGVDNPPSVIVPVENGEFTVPALNDGIYRVEAFFGDVSREDQLLNYNFAMKDGVPAGGLLRVVASPKYAGSLLFADGTAANGSLSLQRLPTDYHWGYNVPVVNGRFVAYLPDGEYHVVSLTGADGKTTSVAAEFTVADGQVRAGSLDIRLSRELSGTIVKADGTPVTKGFVEIHSSAKFGEIHVAEVIDGRFTVPLPDGAYDITYYVSPEIDYYPLDLHIEVKDGQAVTGPLKLTLPAEPRKR
ncbi:S-layer homology domain-containing protein [Paenibacillus sp. NFR01]|uniref:S-layer homology domain-containing protein n=1 Tax=Paenibacillus sp. NFR01 TaxID=1566279 RepID=UPI0008CAACB0|nr:S-layer homology domain-containing protein [Paenibacillus sp. NFR01]SES90068.1 S-layer homology domain-containing protein [Paenibacillus sp. NFR01]